MEPHQDTEADGQDEDRKLLQQIISDAIQENSSVRRGHQSRPHAAASLAEICLASLPGPDLERAMSDLGGLSVVVFACIVVHVDEDPPCKRQARSQGADGFMQQMLCYLLCPTIAI